MKTIAWLLVVGSVRALWRAHQANRAVRWSLAWASFDLGTTIDARRLIEGRLDVDEYRRRQQAREKQLAEALRL